MNNYEYKSPCNYNCVRIPTDNDYCMLETNPNLRSSDLLAPFQIPKSTHPYVGLYVRHKNPHHVDYSLPAPLVAKKIQNREKAFLIPKPQADKENVYNTFNQFKPPRPTKEPSKILRNKIYVRPFNYEVEYMKICRSNPGIEYLRDISTICPLKTEEEKHSTLQNAGNISDHWIDFYGSYKYLQSHPPLKLRISDEERRCLFFRVDPFYKAKTGKWLRENLTSPDLPNIPMKFT